MGFNSKPGILSSHLFEFKYHYSLEQKEEFEREKFSALFDNPVFIEGGITYSKEKMDKLKQLNNPCLDELVDATRQIELYLEIALQLFKKGDARVFGMLRNRTNLAINLKRAMCTLEKVEFSKLDIPYTLTQDEFFAFMEFWDDFYTHIFDVPVFNNIVHNLYDIQNKSFETIFFEYFKNMEILFSGDFTRSGQKREAFKRRTDIFFKVHNYPEVYTEVIESLRQIRHQKAHEASVEQDKIEKISLLVNNNQILPIIDTYHELKEIMRLIYFDFWFLIKKCNYSVEEVRDYLDSKKE